ncbi:MAG: polymer-forming cytoskeletal protein [Pseudomonadota bacterium]
MQDPALDSVESSPNAESARFSEAGTTHAAVIGPGLVVRGEVGGTEDLLVNGRVEGSITLPHNRVVIGEEGRVQANVHAGVLEVFGTVEGDVRADEQVTLRASGDVVGNIAAPRVSIEDGARFRGAIDMDVKAAPSDVRKGVTKPVIMSAADRS